MKSSDPQLEQLTAYLDGELNAHERREVDALLARDLEAAALLESLRRVADSVAALPREAAPSGLSAAVQDRMARRTLLSQESDTRQELPRLVIWTNRLAIAACLALVCTAGWLGVQSREARGPVVVKKESNRTPPAPVTNSPKDSANEKFAFNKTLETSPPPPAVEPTAVASTPTDTGVLVAYREAGKLERQLNDTGVSCREIQLADLSSVSNQLVIETDDPDMRDAVIKLVADFAEDNNIPDVNVRQLPEPVQAQQSFYCVSQSETQQASVPGADETWIAVNAPLNATDKLMTGLENLRTQKKHPVQVEINGCNMETPKQATQLLADNTARNHRLLSKEADSKSAIALGAAKQSPARPTAAAARPLEDEESEGAESDRAKREASAPPSKSTKPPGFAMSKKDGAEPTGGKAEPETAEATKTDADDASAMKKEYKGGMGGKESRGAVAKDARARDDKVATPPVESKDESSLKQPAAQSGDACVTLSICVRNPSAQQRGRVGSSAASQASDTIRQSGATSMPQTSMPAAGAARE